jgi:acetyltransferase-like isoleucine patch superfamily enzyme
MNLLKSYNKIRYFFYRKFISDCQNLKINQEFFYPVIFTGKGEINIQNSQLGVWPSPYFYNTTGYLEARSNSAKISIMNNTAINNNFSIIADKTSITIEENCLIGPNLFITDSDFHGLEVENRNNGNYTCLPVHIGKNVFIGENVRILKGVRIGDGAVIGNSSLVTKNVPAHTVYAGNPAKFIKKLLTYEKE